MAKARVEWIMLAHGGGSDHVLSHVGPARTYAVGPGATVSGPAPSFPAMPGLASRGHARVTAIGGALQVAWTTGEVIGEGRGVRVEPGRSILAPVNPGDMLTMAEAAEPSSAGALVTTSRAGTATAVGSWQVLAPPDPDREAFTVSNTVAGSTLLVAESAQAPSGADYTVVPALGGYTFPTPPKGRLWINESVGTAGDGFGARDTWRRSPLLPSPAAMAYPASGRMGVLSGFRETGAQQSVRRYCRNGVLDLRDLSVDLPNWIVSSAGLETANGNDIVVFAALEYPVGTAPQPFVLDASYAAVGSAPPASAYGATTGVYIPAGQTARARLPGSYLPAQGAYMIHLWAAPAANGALTPGAGVIPSGRFTQNAGGFGDKYLEGQSVANRTAIVGGETTAIGAPANLYSPIVVAGAPVDPIKAALTPSFVVWGDSLAFGFNEQNAYTADGVGDVGPLERWLAGSLGYGVVNMAVSSTKAKDWVLMDLGNFPRSVAAVSGMGSHHVIQLGINDLATSTAAQLQASIERLASFWVQRGRRVYGTTVTPKSSSTDAWATTGAQTTDASNGQRVAYNTTLRAGGVANLTGHVELADTLESARNSGVWKAPGYTADGLHGTATAYAALATALTAAPPFGLVR